MRAARTHALVLVIALGAVACSKYRDPSGDGGGAEPIKQSCPAVKPSNYESILVHATSPTPAKIAVVLNGVRKYDECAGGPLGDAPVVTFERGKLNTSTVRVAHYDAYSTLPTSVSFDLLQLGDCHSAPTLFFRVTDQELKFSEEKPFGPACAGSMAAKADVR